MRADGRRRTLTLDLGLEAPQVAVDLPGFALDGSGSGRALVDVTWEAGALRELTLRSTGARGGRVEEFTARLDLRAPVSRALVERVLRTGGLDGGARRLLTRHMARVGIQERDVYFVSEQRSAVSLAGKLGISLGFSHARTATTRELVEAVTWTGDGPPRRRFDCLGV